MTSVAPAIDGEHTTRGFRLLAMAVSSGGIIAAFVLLWTTWRIMELESVIAMQYTVRAVSTVTFGAFALLIVVKGGNNPANVAMAVFIAVAFSVDTVYQVLFPYCSGSDSLLRLLRMSLFTLGAGFYIRATQKFPKLLTPSNISDCSTVWGRNLVTRTVLSWLLRPAIAWSTVIALTVFGFYAPFGSSHAIARIIVILIGAAYFHISYSSGDSDARRKVLWFLQGVIAIAILSIIALALRTVLDQSAQTNVSDLVSLGLSVVQTLILLACFSIAMFYAGAISPELVVRKTFVYGAVVAMLLFTFSVLQEVLIDSLVDGFGVSGRFMNALLGTALGLAFYPITQRVEKVLSRPRATTQIDKEPSSSQN